MGKNDNEFVGCRYGCAVAGACFAVVAFFESRVRVFILCQEKTVSERAKERERWRAIYSL